MPDQNPKLVVEINADTGQFNVSLNGMAQTLGTTAKQGASGFGDMALAITGVNQGLDLAEKALSAIGDVLEVINKAETFDNKKIALQALGAEVGLTREQLDLLTTTMVKASGETMTSVQATDGAFKLLNAGFRAETIPNLIEFAKRAEEVRGIPLDEGINKLAMAMESGSTRGLKQMGIELSASGSRAEILNAILSQSQEFVKNTGDGYEDFAKKTNTSFAEIKNSAQHYLGGIFRNIGIEVFGSDVDKANQKLALLQAQIQKTKEDETAWKNQGNEVGVKASQQQRAALELQINDAIAQRKPLQASETAAIQDSIQKIKQRKDLEKPIDVQTQGVVRVQNQEKMYTQLLGNDQKYLENSTAIYKGYEAAKTAEINNTYQKQIKDLAGIPMTRAQYAQQELAIERQKYAALDQLAKSSQEVSSRNMKTGFINGIMSMESSYQGFTKTVQKLTTGLGSTMSSTFISMAKAHKFTMDAMLSAMMEFVGESLIQDGTANLLKGAAMSIFGGAGAPLMAAGAAEIAAGSVMVGAGGGGASASSGGGGGSSASSSSQLSTPEAATAQKSASIFIQGDFLQTSETATRLQDIIRKNSDVTNFAIVPQGSSW